jgi:hypothetical protein
MMRVVDKAAQWGMVLGVGFMLNPWWAEGLRYGFFLTALSTIVHIVTSHMELESA